MRCKKFMNNVDDSLFLSFHSEGRKTENLQWIQGMTTNEKSDEMKRKLNDDDDSLFFSLSWKSIPTPPTTSTQRSLTHFAYIVWKAGVLYYFSSCV